MNVRRKRLGSCLICPLLQRPHYRLITETTRQQIPHAMNGIEQRPSFPAANCHPSAHRCQCLRCQLGHSIFLPLTIANCQRPSVQLQINQIQADNFTAA